MNVTHVHYGNVFVTGDILGQAQQGGYEIYSKSNKQFSITAEIYADTIEKKNCSVASSNINLWSINRYDCSVNKYRIDANKLGVNATMTTIKLNQLNLDGQ